MSDTAYVSIHGLDISTIVDREAVNPSGGSRNVEAFPVGGMDYATVIDNGREPLIYTLTFLSETSRADIERARQEFNSCPPGAEFCPFTSDQVAYAESAFATPARSTVTYAGQVYHSEATVVCQGPYLYGTEQGIAFCRNTALPMTATITNSGYYRSELDCFLAGGIYAAGGANYSSDLAVSIDDLELDLCSNLLGGDRFVLDRFGNCKHSYGTTFKKLYAEMQKDLLGNTYFDYGSGGYVLEDNLSIGTDGKIWIPFFGPLPVTTPPHMEVDVLSISGFPEVEIAYSSDLTDAESLDGDDLVTGLNVIDFPDDSIGESFVAIGITTDSSSNIRLSSFNAEVERYVSVSEIPYLDPDESATLTVSDGDSSNHLLAYLLATYRDIY